MVKDKSNILIVDDSESKRTIIHLMLLTSGYRFKVHEAECAKEGLAKVKNIKPHAIILDLDMPEVDGVEMFSKLKENNLSSQVIINTNYGPNSPMLQNVLDLGAEHVLFNAEDPEKLIKVIKKIV